MQEKYEFYLIFVVGTVVVLLLVATILGVVVLHSRERLKYLLRVGKIQAEARERQTEAVIQASELEQERIAKDLHDDLGPLLAGVRLQIAAIHNTYTDADKRQLLSDVIQQLESALKSIRTISRNLYPLEFNNRDFNELASTYISRLQGSDVAPVSFIPAEQPVHFSKEKATAAYRIFSELLLNAIRHSQATHILVSLHLQESHLLLTVADNGVGLQVPQTEGIGLTSIRARADYINARIEMQQNVPSGLVSNLYIPVS